jgi:hypothetical protein
MKWLDCEGYIAGLIMTCGCSGSGFLNTRVSRLTTWTKVCRCSSVAGFYDEDWFAWGSGMIHCLGNPGNNLYFLGVDVYWPRLMGVACAGATPAATYPLGWCAEKKGSDSSGIIIFSDLVLAEENLEMGLGILMALGFWSCPSLKWLGSLSYYMRGE